MADNTSHIYTIEPPRTPIVDEVVVNLGYIEDVGKSVFIADLRDEYRGFLVDLTNSEGTRAGSLLYVPAVSGAALLSKHGNVEEDPEREEVLQDEVQSSQRDVTYGAMTVACDRHIAELIERVKHAPFISEEWVFELVDSLTRELMEMQSRNNNQYALLQDYEE